MADIFISYANEDRETAEQVAHVLENAGFTVWWDRRIPAGRTWRSVLEEALQEMRCLIVLWSENSLNSPWVLEEAEEARRLQKLLFPVLIEAIAPPVGFRAIQAANLAEWDGAADAPAAKLLVTDLKALLGETIARSDGKVGAERAQLPSNGDGLPPASLRRPRAGDWKTWAGGTAAIALLLVVLQMSWPARRSTEPPAKERASEASPPPAPARRLTAIAIVGTARELKTDDTLMLKLQGNYSDGTNEAIATTIKWTSSDSRVVAVDGQGNLTALQPGRAEVAARHGELVSAPWAVVVTAGQRVVNETPTGKMVKLAITPARKELFTQERIALRVFGRYSDQSEKPVARGLRWQVSDPSIAAVTPEGELSGVRPGRVEVSVRAGDVVSSPVAIVVKELPKKPLPYTPAVKTAGETKALAPVPAEAVRPRSVALIARAKSLRDQGQYAAALAELQKAAAIDPSNAEVAKEIDQTRKACAAEVSLGQKIDC